MVKIPGEAKERDTAERVRDNLQHGSSALPSLSPSTAPYYAPKGIDGVVYFARAISLSKPSYWGSSITLGKDCLYAVDGRSGTKRWTVRADYYSGAMLSPAISGGVVYSSSVDLQGEGGYVYAVK